MEGSLLFEQARHTCLPSPRVLSFKRSTSHFHLVIRVVLLQVSRKMASKRKSLPPAKIRARVTLYMTLTCIVSASSGGLFGFEQVPSPLLAYLGSVHTDVTKMRPFRDQRFKSICIALQWRHHRRGQHHAGIQGQILPQ